MKIDFKLKKVLSFILTFSIIISIIPTAILPVSAATVNVLDGQIVIDGDNVSKSGDNINISVRAGWSSKSTTFYIKNNTTSSIEISFDFVASNFMSHSVGQKGESYGAANGSETILLAPKNDPDGGDVVSKTLSASGGLLGNTATLTLSNFTCKIAALESKVTLDFNSSQGGVTANDVSVSPGTDVMVDSNGLKLVATPAEGYRFYRWYDAAADEYYFDANTTILFSGDTTLTAEFISSSTPVFGVGDAASGTESEGGILGIGEIKFNYYIVNSKARFNRLDDAVNYAVENGLSYIVLLESGTLSAGDYTIPAGITLLIPFDSNNKGYKSTPRTEQIPTSGVVMPEVYKTLTVEDGTNITLNGNIEVAAKHYTAHGGNPIGGRPVRYFGKIDMKGASKITVNSGANLYVWGYITGSSEAQVIAESGATIYEKMQVADYRGGNGTTDLASERFFPFSQYYIQNVEIKETIKYGANLVGHASVYASSIQIMPMNFIGSSSMFTLEPGSMATKYYDSSNDRLTIDVEGNFSFKPISIKFQSIYTYDTNDFVLPLNQNLTINFLSGTTTINQDILLQPGCTINIGEEAVLNVASGKNVYIFDSEQWGNFCFQAPTKQITYIASTNAAPVQRDLRDAQLNINGVLNIEGQIYATDSRASIISDNRSGRINFTTAVGSSSVQSDENGEYIYQCTTNDTNGRVKIYMYPVYLTNGNTTYSITDTSGTAAGTTYYYNATCDMWVTHGANGHGYTWKANESEHWQECVCGNKINYGTHADENLDHNCDNGCDVVFGEHKDDGKDHVCDYGCNETIGACEDTNKDHLCDHGCGKYFGVHADSSKDTDHVCDYGCGAVLEECVDSNKDHVCDNGCDKPHGEHVDAGKDHVCDYGCQVKIGECADSDTDNDHVCDYGCGKIFSDCLDVETDKDHSCDICGKENVTEHKFTYGEYVWNDDFSSCTRTRTCNCTYTETAIATITSIVKSPATCEGKGWTTYTATFTEDWAETQTKDVEDIEPLGHRFTNESDSECDYCEYTRAAYIGDVSYVTFEDALAAAKEGDTIVVLSQIVIEGERTLDLTGITLDSKYINSDNYAMVVRGDLTIVGGTFNFENFYGIGTTANGKLTINGGKYSTTKDYYLIGNFGETVINDGEFTSLYCNVNSFDGKVIINGGKFTVTDYSNPNYPPCDVFAEEKGVAIIKGGNFSTDVTEHCPEGHTIKDENGRYPYEKHNYNAVVTPPTCTEGGYTTYTCVCGDNYVDNYVDETGHSYDAVVTPPTCTEQGYTTHTCHCGDTYVDNYVDATGHSHDAVVTSPTCTEQGYTTHTCHCGDTYVDNYVDETGHLDNNHDHVCENGCNEQIGSCEDTDFDHDCDYGCDKSFGEHKDAGYDHNCDYGCKEKIGTCADNDFDHDCDYGCDKVFGECSDSDTDNDHVCDYGCGAVLEECKDTDTDNDHNCDICGKQNVTEHEFTYGEYVWNDDFSSCTRTRTCNCTYTETAIATITSIVKSPATCEGKGWTTYTATFTEDWAETQTKDVEDIEPLGHSFMIDDCKCDNCDFTREAYIGDVSYKTFEDALAAANEGDTIVVLSQIVIEGERTLDLTGITLDSKYINFDDYAMVVRGDLTIVGGTFNFENYYGIGTTANGKLTINGGKYSTTKDYYLIGNFGETVINDGEFTSLYCNVNSFDGKVIINGGKFTVTDYSYPDYPPCDVFAEEKGEAIINGGNFSTDVSKHCPEGHTIKDENGRYPFEKHNYNAAVTPPTCTEGGYTTYTCVCGDTYVDNDVDATGHSHDAVVIPPTCTEQGYTTHTCHCGDTYVDNFVDATGHKHGSFEYDLYKHWSICSVEGCGTIFDEEAHDFINDACKCGAKRVSVEIVGNVEVNYSVVGQTVTVTHKDACTIAYIVDGEYVKLESVLNADGSYSFTSPDNIEDVKLFVIGDYDANGEITTEDATLLRDALLGKDTLNDTPDFVYDVNGDNKITALDLALISAAAQRSIKLG